MASTWIFNQQTAASVDEPVAGKLTFFALTGGGFSYKDSSNVSHNLVSASGSITAGHLAVFSDTTGDLVDGGPAPVLANLAYLNAANIFTQPQTISLNTTTLPAAQTGTVLRIANADGTPTRMELSAFGAAAFFTAITYGGTNAAPTALTANTQMGGYNSWGYTGSAVVGPAASFRTYAAENWSTGHQGSYADIATTPIGSTTLTEAIRFENDGGITVPSTVTGGSKGAGTINATSVYLGGTALGTMATQNANAVAITGGTVDGTVIGGATPSSASLTFLSLITSTSVPNIGTNGALIRTNGAAVTTDTGSSGTVAEGAIFTLGGGIVNSTNVVTYTQLETLRLGAPTVTGNASAGSLLALVVASGGAKIAGGLTVSGGTTVTGTTNINASNNAATNIGTGTTTNNVHLGGSANNVMFGAGGNLATTATSGFMVLPTCAGAPTGSIAASGAGNAYLVYDLTNSKLWINVSGSSTWKGVVLS